VIEADRLFGAERPYHFARQRAGYDRILLQRTSPRQKTAPNGLGIRGMSSKCTEAEARRALLRLAVEACVGCRPLGHTVNNAVERFTGPMAIHGGWTGGKFSANPTKMTLFPKAFAESAQRTRFFHRVRGQRLAGNNTRPLLETGWTGLWIEGLPEYSDIIQVSF
jgi:hypothetical protein